MSNSSGKFIAFGIFVLPLIVLGVWVWEETPGSEAASGNAVPDVPGALTISVTRPGPGRMRVTYANASARKITVVVQGRPGGVLRIVKPGTPAGPPRSVAFSAEDDARVELLPGGAYIQVYDTNARAPADVIYDARGTGFPLGTWRGIARSGLPDEAGKKREDRQDTNGRDYGTH